MYVCVYVCVGIEMFTLALSCCQGRAVLPVLVDLKVVTTEVELPDEVEHRVQHLNKKRLMKI